MQKTSDEILQQLKRIPKQPGCYKYFNSEGEIIYVGKAKNLYNRVNSYFRGNKKDSIKVIILVSQIAKIDYITVNSELEALILENELIKKHQPKYNILLKDDKKFPYFVITKDQYTRIIIARKANKNAKQGKYFGPYTDIRAMHATLEVIGKIFPLKKCTTPKYKNRPCLYYDIGQCSAPCQEKISKEDYKKLIDSATLFLSGKSKELVKTLNQAMKKASQNQDFEKALLYRNAIQDINTTLEKQNVIFKSDKINYDYISHATCSDIVCISLLEVRQGRLINKKDLTFKKPQENEDNLSEIYSSALGQYYSILDINNIPSKIILDIDFEENNLYQDWLSGLSSHNVKIVKTKTAQDKKMIELAKINAKNKLNDAKLKALISLQNNYNDIGKYLQEKLNLKKFPHTIECYDISHIQGTNTVASGVFFENGEPKKSQYRKYKLKTLQKGEVDDFKSMR
ncbi:excinuclease ABC subunit C, partial [bacterium]|nr:excinuclease ABC subunit C [bacterium]